MLPPSSDKKENPVKKQANCIMLVWCLNFSSPWRSGRRITPKHLLVFQWAAQHSIPEHNAIHNYRTENPNIWNIVSVYFLYFCHDKGSFQESSKFLQIFGLSQEIYFMENYQCVVRIWMKLIWMRNVLSFEVVLDYTRCTFLFPSYRELLGPLGNVSSYSLHQHYNLLRCESV
jgi:hypothetical protein